MKPQADLPGKLERGQRAAMIAGQRVAGRIAAAPHFIEHLVHFARQYPVILQTPQQVVLRFFRGNEQSRPGCQQLRQRFRQLTQLQKTGVRIVRKILFRQHPEMQQLFVVLTQYREV